MSLLTSHPASLTPNTLQASVYTGTPSSPQAELILGKLWDFSVEPSVILLFLIYLSRSNLLFPLL